MKKTVLSVSIFTYSQKLAEACVIEVVNKNYSLVAPLAAIPDNAFERISSEIDNNVDLYNQQQNEEVNDDHIGYSENLDKDTFETTEVQSADLWNTNSFINQVKLVPDNVINENLRAFKMQ